MNRARKTPSVRSCRTSGAMGAKVWSSSATATISTTSVKLMPNRLVAVKNGRRHNTRQASNRWLCNMIGCL